MYYTYIDILCGISTESSFMCERICVYINASMTPTHEHRELQIPGINTCTEGTFKKNACMYIFMM